MTSINFYSYSLHYSASFCHSSVASYLFFTFNSCRLQSILTHVLYIHTHPNTRLYFCSTEFTIFTLCLLLSGNLYCCLSRTKRIVVWPHQICFPRINTELSNVQLISRQYKRFPILRQRQIVVLILLTFGIKQKSVQNSGSYYTYYMLGYIKLKNNISKLAYVFYKFSFILQPQLI